MSHTVISVQGFDASLLDIARGAFVEGVVKTGDLIVNYARAMEQSFNRVDLNGNIIAKWFDLVGKDKKGVNGERARFVQAMMDRDPKFIKTSKVNADGSVVRVPTATVDTYWARVKEASGYVPSNRVSGTTDVDTKTMSELKTMINRILKAEEAGESPIASNFRDQLTEIFEELGGDKGTLGK